MAPNDSAMYKLTENYKRTLKSHEMKARAICNNLQQEKGSNLRLPEYFDD